MPVSSPLAYKLHAPSYQLVVVTMGCRVFDYKETNVKSLKRSSFHLGLVLTFYVGFKPDGASSDNLGLF